MKKMSKKLLAVVLMFISSLLIMGNSMIVQAATTQNIQITNDGQVVDSFNGVDAAYVKRNSNSGEFSCAGYVKKYYETVFGVSVSNLLSNRTPIVSESGYEFREVTSGILPSDLCQMPHHWAITKEADGDRLTLIEQNWKYKDAQGRIFATINREVTLGETEGLVVYRLFKDGQAVNIDTSNQMSSDKPIITATYWGSVTSDTCRPVVEIKDAATVQNVDFCAWSTPDMSDIRWYGAYHNQANAFFYDMATNGFKNRTIYAHCYVTGKDGSTQSFELERLTISSSPEVTSTYWGSVTSDTCRPVVEIKDAATVQNVDFCAWSTPDMSDIRWYGAYYNQANAFFYDMPTNEFKNRTIYVHCYVTGKDGSTQSFEYPRLKLD